jgi:multidrug efflux pump subunit AcrB
MKVGQASSKKGIIAWFAGNHVAANLLMLFIIVAGLMSAMSIRQETQPEFELNRIQVIVPYLGAAPQEVEEGVVIKVEEAIQDLDGIQSIRSQAYEGSGNVMIEVKQNADLNEVMSEVKTRVDAISTFPALTEKPIISKLEVERPVIVISIHGDLDEFARKALAQEMRDDLMQLPEVNKVLNLGDRAYEISIEVSEQTLRKYGLTMSEVSQAIRNSSVDLPGGAIKAVGGDILLRTEGQVYTGSAYGQLVLRTFADGTRLKLGDIATIKDGFVETDEYARFDGEDAGTLQVVAGGQDNEIETSAAVKRYVAAKAATLPDGVEIDTWIDLSEYLQARLSMMYDNMIMGALLVFVMLSLFLRMKVAFWVIIGLPVCFLGALWLMPLWPVTVNLISLFGFIIVLGIVVDDAIIIGESIYTTIRSDGHTLENVVKGAHRVAIPATFGVLTTIAAFAPMLFVGGIPGPFFEAMSFVIILCLAFSLIESKLILPAHLTAARIPDIDEDDLFHPQRQIPLSERIPRAFLKVQRHVQHGLHSLINDYYRPALQRVVDYRGISIATFMALLILTVGLLGSGIARVVVFPEIASDFIQVRMEMQRGSSATARNRAVDKIEAALLKINADYVRDNPNSLPVISHLGVFTDGDSSAQIFAEMPFDPDRPYEMTEVADMWRDAVGEIAGMKELEFSGASHIGGGPPLSFRFSGPDYAALEAAAIELASELGDYDGVFDIVNSSASGGDEIKLSIKPEAEALGLTIASLGRQVRQAFYGEEAQRIQRGKDELRVMVRYPIEERRSVADLENMRIRTPDGSEVPFGSVANVSFGESYSRISRLDRERTITVSANIDPERVEPQQIIQTVSAEFIPEMLSRYPGVKYGLAGASEEQRDFLRNLQIAAIAALFLIYALIAIPLRSYSYPLIIMSVIPFGLIGAVIGHVIMGKAISMFSLFGLIALAGVVVNDSLILIDHANKARADGTPARQAIVDAGAARFRAIVLTSFTTAAGLMPILFETSTQAQLVIPMAISISFGIIFATVITLFLIPALYLLKDDAMARLRRIRAWVTGSTAPDGAAAEPERP